MQRHHYLVYQYQYREMRRPRVDAVRFDGMRMYDAVDLMPPTVKMFASVITNSKREAIKTFRERYLVK